MKVYSKDKQIKYLQSKLGMKYIYSIRMLIFREKQLLVPEKQTTVFSQAYEKPSAENSFSGSAVIKSMDEPSLYDNLFFDKPKKNELPELNFYHPQKQSRKLTNMIIPKRSSPTNEKKGSYLLNFQMRQASKGGYYYNKAKFNEGTYS